MERLIKTELITQTDEGFFFKLGFLNLDLFILFIYFSVFANSLKIS